MSTEHAGRPRAAKASKTPSFATTLHARVLRHDSRHGLSTLFFGDGELRVPIVAAPVDSGVKVTIYARDVSIALSRPMDVSITNRLPGTIVEIEPLELRAPSDAPEERAKPVRKRRQQRRIAEVGPGAVALQPAHEQHPLAEGLGFAAPRQRRKAELADAVEHCRGDALRRGVGELLVLQYQGEEALLPARQHRLLAALPGDDFRRRDGVGEILPGAALQSDDELLHYLRQMGSTVFHATCTCKMGQDAMAVVDDQLRVHGIEGLRVIDASVMPTVTSTNTNAPTIMIAEKGAAMIKAAARQKMAA